MENSSEPRMAVRVCCEWQALFPEVPFSDSPVEACGELATQLRGVGVTQSDLVEALAEGGREPQVVGLETSEGRFILEVLRLEPAARRRPARPRCVMVRRNGRWIGESVAPRRWGLPRRIAKAIGITDRTYVRQLRRLLKEVIRTNPGAGLHKVRLLPGQHGFEGHDTVWVTIHRRL